MNTPTPGFGPLRQYTYLDCAIQQGRGDRAYVNLTCRNGVRHRFSFLDGTFTKVVRLIGRRKVKIDGLMLDMIVRDRSNGFALLKRPSITASWREAVA